MTRMTLFKGIGQDDRINPTNNTKQVVLKNRIYCKEQSGQKNRSRDCSGNKEDGNIIYFNGLWGTMIQQLLFIFFIHSDSMMTGWTEEIIRIGIVSTDSAFSS